MPDIFDNIKEFFRRFFSHSRPKISILIPFSTTDHIRRRNFRWLLRYWRHELPHAEIIIGKSNSKVFCKGEALNNALKRSRGKILVVLDADALLEGRTIERCADRILEELHRGHHLWYVPYRHLYRLTRQETERIIHSDPKHPYRPHTPPPNSCIENQGDFAKYGARYAAMVTIFPREALKYIKCFDERFKGWGGEDIALLRALDTLFGKHKTVRGAVFHLWHPFHGHTYKERVWDNQENPNANSRLANKYNAATRSPHRMGIIVGEAWAHYLAFHK